MEYPLVLIDFEEYKKRRDNHEDLAGYCFFAHDALQKRILAGFDAREPSAEYLADWAGKRNVLFIHLPGGPWSCWSPDCKSHEPGGAGWKVTGEVPQITVEPSIHLPGIYHGTITDGIISENSEPLP
jgi:hypothetical protein